MRVLASGQRLAQVRADRVPPLVLGEPADPFGVALGQFPLHRAKRERLHRIQQRAGQIVLSVGLAGDGERSLGLAQRVRAEPGPGGGFERQPRVGQHDSPGAASQRAQVGAPVAGGRRRRLIAVRGVHDQLHDVVPARDVAVQRHGARAQLGGESPHRDRGQPLRVGEPQRRRGDPVGVQPSPVPLPLTPAPQPDAPKRRLVRRHH